MKQDIAVQEKRDLWGSTVEFVRVFIAEGAAVWGVSRNVMWAIALIPFVVAGMGALSALFGKETYKWFTAEDGFAESLQVIFYFLSFAMALFITWRHHRAGERLLALLYLGLTLAFVFMIGEEISWGQRIFGWGTPDPLVEINKQDETNFHNIYGVGATFKWLQMLVGAYGVVLPLALLRWPPRRQLKKLTDAVVPHYTFIFFFLPMFVWRLFRNTMEVPEDFYFVVAEYNEVIELILASGFALFLLFQLRRLYARPDRAAAGTKSER